MDGWMKKKLYFCIPKSKSLKVKRSDSQRVKKKML